MKKFIFAAMLVATLPLTAFAESHGGGDAEAGEKGFKKCKACHMVGTNAKNRVGRTLNGVVGRQSAQVEGYKYSKAMTAAELTWDEETLTSYLANPRKAVKGTKMAFAGLKKEQQIIDLITYLDTLK